MATQQEWFTDLGSKSWTGVDGWMKFDYNPTLYPKFSTVTYASVRWRGTCGFNIGRHGVTLHIKDVNGKELYQSKRLISNKDGVVQVVDGLEQYFQADGMMRHLDFHSNGSYMWTEVGGVHVTIRGVPTTVNFNLSATAGGTVEGGGEVIVPPNHQSMTHTIRALPNGEYEFEYWALDGGQNTNPSIDYTISDTSPFVTQNINTINGQAYFKEKWIQKFYVGEIVPNIFSGMRQVREVYKGTTCVWKKDDKILIEGDTYQDDLYEYKYNQKWNALANPPKWETNTAGGWGAKLLNPQATTITHGPMASIKNRYVTNLDFLYMNSPATTIKTGKMINGKITSMKYMFANTKTNLIDLTGLEVSESANTENMFLNAKFVKGYAKNQRNVDLLNRHPKTNIPQQALFIIKADDGRQIANGTVVQDNYYEYHFMEAWTGSRNRWGALDPKVTPMGWGVRIKEGVTLPDDTPPVATSLQGYPVVAMINLFYTQKLNKVTFNKFNTTHTVGFMGLFSIATIGTTDISNLDICNAIDLSYAFSARDIRVDCSKLHTNKSVKCEQMFAEYWGPVIDLSSFDASKINNSTKMFNWATSTTGYARTQADADILNKSSGKPAELTFVVKP